MILLAQVMPIWDSSTPGGPYLVACGDNASSEMLFYAS
jgi:hypothetical protein